MKKLLYLLVLFCCLFSAQNTVKALSPYEIESRAECPIIELAEAKTDGSLAKIECYETYQDAKNVMNTTENDNLVLIEKGIIIDAKYAVIDYDIAYPSGHLGYINIYTTATSNTTDGYIRSSTPDDAAVIEVDYTTKRVKIKIAGNIGWINKYDGTLKLYDIVPLSWAKKTQYYKVTNESLVHYYPGNVYGTKDSFPITIDKKPEMLEVGDYYSYDGNYFYKDMKTLLQDYKNGNYNQAVNKDKPYYNYYQYVSFRTKTSYSLENINQYISKRASTNSKMIDSGAYFIDVQNKYGVNAALMMAIGMNESNKGSSPIAQTKNNLFGLNAIDAAPGESASPYETVGDCISDYGYRWLSYGYLHPGDHRFYGANLGNKYQGLNYKYASDPFWSEKAAQFYYDLDKMFGFQDRDSYQIAVLNNDYSNTVYPKKTVGGENISSSYYQYKEKGSSVVVLEEVEGIEVNGNKIWYKIQADPTLDSNLNYIGDSKSNPRITYDWPNNIAYVPSVYFTKANTAITSVPNNPSTNPEPTPDTTPETPTPEPETPEPETPPAKAISAIVTEAKYKYENGNISGITPGTSIEIIKTNLTNTGGVITITDSNGNTKENGNIGTGDKVNITSGTTESLTVLIYGDIDGTGSIDVLDLVALKQHLLGTMPCTGIYMEAANFDNEGSIDVIDLVAIKQYLLNK